MIKTYTQHALSLFMRHFTETESAALRESIKAGYDPTFPILLYEGQVLDGWNRYVVCCALEEAGHDITPVFVDFSGSKDEAVTLVSNANLNRRHLSASARAAGIVVLDLQRSATMRHSVGQIAEQVGVGQKTARTIQKAVNAAPEIAEQVARGELPVARLTEAAAAASDEGGDDVKRRRSRNAPFVMKYTLQRSALIYALSSSDGGPEALLNKILDDHITAQATTK